MPIFAHPSLVLQINGKARLYRTASSINTAITVTPESGSGGKCEFDSNGPLCLYVDSTLSLPREWMDKYAQT